MHIQTSNRQPSPNAPGMYGVQTWSAGAIYPAVIKVVENYSDDYQGVIGGAAECINGVVSLASRLSSRHFVLMLDGVEDTYASREDAEQAAAFLLNHPVSREARRTEGSECDPYPGGEDQRV